MESLEDILIPVELKYCKRCGGLWFRPKGEQEVLGSVLSGLRAPDGGVSRTAPPGTRGGAGGEFAGRAGGADRGVDRF